MSESDPNTVPVVSDEPAQVALKAAPAEEKSRSCLGAAAALTGIVAGAIYVTNPGAGLFELIPDVVPLFGNLDEAGATALLVLGLQYLFGRNRAG